MSASRSVSSRLRSNLGDTVSAIAVATASAASAALRAAAARVWTDLRAVTDSVTPVTLTGSKRWSSRFEGFPNVLLEAMAHGVPCVSVDCDTGPRDLISSEENGLLIPNNSSKHLRSSMEILMRDITLARALGQSAKEVREKFSINTIGVEWDALIASCLMNPRI